MAGPAACPALSRLLGFRMPADRDDAACTGAGVRKPSMNETAGSGRRSCRGRYGDLRAADELVDGSRYPWVRWSVKKSGSAAMPSPATAAAARELVGVAKRPASAIGGHQG